MEPPSLDVVGVDSGSTRLEKGGVSSEKGRENGKGDRGGEARERFIRTMVCDEYIS